MADTKEPVFLRMLEPSDVEKTYRWHNDPQLYADLIGTFHFVSKDTEEQWLKKKCQFSSSEINLAICRSDTSEHIGNMYLREIDWVCRNALLHIFIAQPNCRGKGYGKSAIMQILDLAFTHYALHKVHLTVLSTNTPAIKLYEKCGFRNEGEMREHVFKNGAWVNMFIMGILSSEFKRI